MVIRLILRALALSLAPLPLAAAAPAPTIKAILELTDLSSVAISPDGRTVVYRSEIASIDRNRVEFSWFVVPIDGHSPPRRVANAGAGEWSSGSVLPEPATWSSDSHWFYYRADVDGAKQIWRASVDGAHVEQVTHDDANVTSFALRAGVLIYAAGASRAAIAAEEAAEYDGGVRIDKTIEPALPLFGGVCDRGSRFDAATCRAVVCEGAAAF